ncbi:MAG: UDP-2,3-diacylglucosamine hydrolase [Lysobacteraceae bacterium]|nr:MAG: UDP-2,3-diacylglucosamine hydrolase [Xanthomonadaceae bacterium]
MRAGEEVAKALAGLAGHGVEIGLIHGNRDFLLGADFARRAGVRLLPDPCVVELAGQAILLSHGDRYCTDDASYQAFRQQVRAPEWQRAFLARPLAERKAYARKARQESADHQRGQPPELGDVVDASVEAELALFGVDRLIHGHTHRPACHRHRVGQRTVERWVLADWREHGEVLVLADDGRLAREVLR